MTNTEQKYWFPAKRYGWGWGIPSTWQGWVVLVTFGMLFALGAFIFPPKTNAASFLVYTTGLSALLITVCYLKGEPPSWRWGKD